MELLGDMGHVESRFNPFRESVSVGARKCTVCTDRTTGSEIVLDEPDGTNRRCASVESPFNLFGNNVSVGAR
jgi:hypothetical protein